MIDYFALALMHALFALALLRLVRSEALDREEREPNSPRAVAGPVASGDRDRQSRDDQGAEAGEAPR